MSIERDIGEGSLAGQVGRRLRTARRRRGLTLAALAGRAGMSESFLSQLERGLTGASLDSLQRLTQALDIRVGDLFETSEVDSPRVLHPEQRPVMELWHLGAKTLLTPRWSEDLEVLICRLEPEGSTGDEPYTHGDSDELFLVLEGVVDLELDGRLHRMTAGDSITYRSSVPHRVINRGDGDAEGLWAISPPSF
ncbi:MAG TPA: XRE family transcriptional regulator [Solirubrobacteraceae bacterium]|jgi:transcriptional regulator with XRE-family HTH domain